MNRLTNSETVVLQEANCGFTWRRFARGTARIDDVVSIKEQLYLCGARNRFYFTAMAACNAAFRRLFIGDYARMGSARRTAKLALSLRSESDSISLRCQR